MRMRGICAVLHLQLRAWKLTVPALLGSAVLVSAAIISRQPFWQSSGDRLDQVLSRGCYCNSLLHKHTDASIFGGSR
ncbi:uncharacterized protein BJ212DRAFT_1397345 [Suillus subaureus]|uniref:Uncharacterized protein n=1 Tax=Suillus subaureus TaxID=48587 RepID=A0A9P7DTD7_9AGAM|nr:uncharacterized protein BJ212DRAFT_1397345 [Suillus subaureus]KAG1802547.1 hypothetical protein BJ212DRAFT_1397345 [Suillus subaureus]